MRRSIRWRGGRGFPCYAFLCVGLLAAQSASADSNGRSKSEAAQGRDQIQTPMTGKGVGAAPYSVRLRITGFLARQHARDGDTHRALIEYHSMLNVDDPAWPDNEEGDSLRIARDIEVAQMMSESGFYDHAIRVLQTTFILARVNKDPQAAVVERQMLATAELAELKGVAVPMVDLSFACVDVNMPQFSAVEPPPMTFTGAGKPVLSAASEVGPVVAQPKSPPSSAGLTSLPELPPSNPRQLQFEETRQPHAEAQPKEESRLSKLLPWRRRFATRAVAESTMPTTEPQTQTPTSPNVSPTYCSECAGLHHRSLPQPKSAISASPRATQYPSVAHAPSPIAHESKNARSSVGTPVVAEATAARTKVSTDSGPELTVAELDHRSLRPTAQEELSKAETNGDGPSLRPAHTPEIGGSNKSGQELAAEPVTFNPSGHVGVAGQVPNPGIFTFEGTSTTLAALLRRTGEVSNDTIKQTRILRSVDLHRVTDSVDPLRDFYCQRIEVMQPAGDELELPVYGQEIVIVDGAGPKPIYVAVMPHFILQIPIKTSHSVTAEQIVDQLRVYWPNVRRQEIGVVRFEQWSRASKIARLKDGDGSAEAPMKGGDVLYVDGLNLDRSQVLSAAEAIARLAGAKIRSSESGVQQSSGSSR